MKFLIYILLLGVFTLAAIWLVPYLPGFVLIRIGGWAIETSVIALLVALILIYFVMSGSVWLWHLPGNSARKFVDRRARAQLELGMLALAEGEWSKAEKALEKSARNSANPSVNYLAAAEAAHGPGAEERRERYLEMADRCGGDAHVSVVLTRARLLLTDRNPAGAVEVLSELPDRLNRPRALDLLARCYEQLGAWQELAAIAPDLVRHGIIDTAYAQRLTTRAVKHRLAAADSQDTLRATWEALSKAQRQDSEILGARVERSIALGGAPLLEPELRKTLSKHWSSDIARIYGRIAGGDTAARLAAARGWLRDHPDDPWLHLVLGRLHREAGDLDAALTHFEQASAAPDMVGALAELGALHERRGDTQAAMTAYRNELQRTLPAILDVGPVDPHQIEQSRTEIARVAAGAAANTGSGDAGDGSGSDEASHDEARKAST